MTPPLIFIFGLTVLPLVIMICMAFTNYSKLDNHLVLFDWVGLENFRTLSDSNSILGSTFWSVLAWTVIWAFFATFSNYIFGMILAMVINRPGTKAKSFWRFCFVLSCAVPSFVSLLIMRTMLQPDGAVNVLLRNLGWIASDSSLPFFTDSLWAKVTIIVINIWVGVPYTLLQLTGVLQNIPGELYEAAKIDGANTVQIFSKITLPLSKPVIVYTVLTAFIGPWVDFIFAKVICRANADYYTVAIGLWRMLEKEYIDNWYTSFAAGAVLISIPIAILFMFLQKYYVDGMSGAVKG